MNYEEATAAVSALVKEAKDARMEALGLRSILGHATVELAMRDEKIFEPHRERRRAELFALYDAGKLRISIGGGRCVVELV